MTVNNLLLAAFCIFIVEHAITAYINSQIVRSNYKTKDAIIEDLRVREKNLTQALDGANQAYGELERVNQRTSALLSEKIGISGFIFKTDRTIVPVTRAQAKVMDQIGRKEELETKLLDRQDMSQDKDPKVFNHGTKVTGKPLKSPRPTVAVRQKSKKES